MHTPSKAYSNFHNLSSIPQADVQVAIQKKEVKDNIIYTIRLNNSGKHVAFFANLKLKNENKEIISPAFWSDNYVSLTPGEEKVLTCRIAPKDVDAQPCRIEISGWNIPLRSVTINK
uniref:CAZy families GH2 protein n=1 Tax=uncultured Zunongwangia sp. TaxID=941974 RepID=A0A060C4V3_9FLAO|nr:CAZy families GH2 protein [uncultured Zunongwangia sp.]